MAQQEIERLKAALRKDWFASGFDSACSCYIGRSGGCHHCDALAQTFLDAAESIKQKRRQGIQAG